jgi:hypothetical protein
VAMDNPLDGGQADAGPFVLFGPVQALEDAEQLWGVAHVEAHTVVSHKVNDRSRLVRILARTDLDPSGMCPW